MLGLHLHIVHYYQVGRGRWVVQCEHLTCSPNTTRAPYIVWATAYTRRWPLVRCSHLALHWLSVVNLDSGYRAYVWSTPTRSALLSRRWGEVGWIRMSVVSVDNGYMAYVGSIRSALLSHVVHYYHT